MRATRPTFNRRALFALLASVAIVGGCGKRETAVEEGNRTQVLHAGNGVEPGDLDPHTNTGSPESVIFNELFEGLVTRDAHLNVVPGCAAALPDVDAGGRILTFHLRPGLKWSNGDPLTARDFRDSMKRFLDPSLGAEFAFMAYPVAGAEDYNTGKTHDFSTVGFQALDDRTFRVLLSEPTPTFLQLLTGYPFVPVHIPSVAKFGGLERKGTQWTRAGNLVSNGRMMLAEWKPNQVITLVRNPNHWNKDHSVLKEIRYYPIESQDTEERAFRSGQLHLTYTLLPSKIDTYRAGKSPALHISPRLGVNYVVFNTAKQPFDDARVRKAFSLAIDREQISTSIYRGGYSPAYVVTQDGMGGFHPQHRITGGPVEARALLAEAGFPGGKGFPHVEYLYNTSEVNRDVAQALQQMWRKELGIEVDVINQEWKVFLDNRHNGNFEVARAGWNPFADDPAEYFQQVISNSQFNDSKWKNAEFDALYVKAIHTLDAKERYALYQRMDDIMLDEMPVAPLAHSSEVRLIQPSVKGWVDNLLDTHPMSELRLETGEAP